MTSDPLDGAYEAWNEFNKEFGGKETKTDIIMAKTNVVIALALVSIAETLKYGPQNVTKNTHDEDTT